MKKFVSMLLALAMCLSLAAPALAAEEEKDESLHKAVAVMPGILTNEDGETYEISGFLVENECVPYGMNPQDEFSATYQFDVPSRIIQNGSSTVDGSDDGYESTIWLTIKWKVDTHTELYNTYLLTDVSGHWTIFDDTRVSVTSTNLVYGCTDPLHNIQVVYPGIAVENNFNISTGFTDYVSLENGSAGANLTLNYLMGTSRRWSFTIQNNI